MDSEIQEVSLSRPDVVVIDDNPHLSSPPLPHPNVPSNAPVPSAAPTNATNNPATSTAANALASNMQPASSRTDPLENLEKALESASETLASLATSVMHFSYESQDLVYNKVYVDAALVRLRLSNDFVNDLRKIDTVSQGVNADIPFEIIETIDKGRNPEQCTYQMLESCAEANNNARGKLAVIRSLRSAMEAATADADGKSGGKDGGVSVGNVVTNGF